MDTFSFSALGTAWNVSVDGTSFDDGARHAVREFLATFETHFSRFRPESEVNAFRNVLPGSHAVSPDLAVLLARAKQLQMLTNGAFDPVVALALERAGYGRGDMFSPTAITPETSRADWMITGKMLTISAPTAFDLGGIAKGYAIDRVADLLRDWGYAHVLVEGGGDMFGTTKADGSGWRVAVEWPGRSDTAISVITLSHGGFAASDVFRRRVGDGHHILDATTDIPVSRVIGAAATARTAWDADSMTSLLFLSPSEGYAKLATLFHAQYIVVDAVEKVYVSHNWGGEVFV
jgi:FAD:protein FMN transferase